MIRLQRIDGDAGESRRADRFALGRDFDRPLLPALTAVLRAKKHRRRRRAGADKYVVWIHRIDADRPDVIRIERRVEVLPVGAAILAAIQPSFRACEENIVLLRMHRDATHRSFIGKSAARPDARPSLSIVFAPHDALPDRADDNRYILHDSSSDDLNYLNGLNFFDPLMCSNPTRALASSLTPKYSPDAYPGCAVRPRPRAAESHSAALNPRCLT